MRLEHLHAENFRSHERLDLNLAAVECAAIVGPNGTGKTSILRAVEWALYGGPGSPDSVIRYGEDRGGVTVEFTSLTGPDGQPRRWRVSRTRDRQREKSLLVLEESAGDAGWSPIKRNTIREVQALVEEVVGMDHDQFRASIYAPQGQAGLLAGMTPGGRKELLGSLLGLGRYEDWRLQASGEGRDLDSMADGKEARARDLRMEVEARPAEDYESLETERTLLAGAAEHAEQEVTEAIARQERLQAWQRRQGLVSEMNALLERHQARERAAAAIRELEESITGREHLRADLTEREAWWTGVVEQQAEVRAAIASWHERRDAAQSRYLELGRAQEAARQAWTRERDAREHAQERLQMVTDREPKQQQADVHTCPTCRQEIAGDEARAAVAAHFEHEHGLWVQRLAEIGAEIEAHEACEAELLAAYKAYEQPVQEAADAKHGMEAAPREVQPDTEKAKALSEARAEVQALDADVARLSGLRQALDADQGAEQIKAAWQAKKAEVDAIPAEQPPAGVSIEQARAQARQAAAAVTAVERRIGEAQARREQNAAKLTQADELEQIARSERARATALHTVAKACSRTGIPAMILDNAVEGIEQAANAALRQVAGDGIASSMSLRLATQVDRKGDKGVRETLEILVDDGAYERPLESYSGGEAYRVHIALRLGLAEVLSKGAANDVLLIDEPTDLDASGMQLLADMLPSLERQVLLVTHEGALVSGLPQTVTVERPSMAHPSQVTVS